MYACVVLFASCTSLIILLSGTCGFAENKKLLSRCDSAGVSVYIILIITCDSSTEKYLQGEDVTRLASMCKLKSGRLAREASDACLQYYGGVGFTNDMLVSRLYRFVIHH